MSDEPGDELQRLVIEALSRIEDQGLEGLESLCREQPKFADRLRRRVGRLLDAGLVPTPDRAPRPYPERLGDFRLLERLGGGGMGVVYRAEQVSLRREVALKLVRPDQLYFPGTRERFRREVAIVAGLSHPGIVPVYAFGEEDGLPFFAMEYVRGATLAETLDALRGGTFGPAGGEAIAAAIAARSASADDGAASAMFEGAWEQICTRIAREIAEALEHAHRRGVVHRDVKPSNVMVTSTGRVMLLDFGLSATSGSERITRSGSVLGSLAYMAPEQLRGGEVGARSDVYALGVSLWEMLALRLPFDEQDPQSLADRIRSGGLPPLRRAAPGCSWEIETIVATATDPDPGRRYASAEAFARDLGHALARRPIEARPARGLLRLRRWAQRHPARAVAAAAAFLLFFVAPTVVAWREHRARTIIAEQRSTIVAANAGLAAALSEASEQREAADRNFRRARLAVQEMLLSVGTELLDEVPLMDGVRRELVAKAIAFYEDLLDEAPERADLLLDTAASAHALAELYGRVERWEDLAVARARERELLERAAATGADPVVVGCRRAATLRADATAALLQGRPGEAAPRIEAALAAVASLDQSAEEVRRATALVWRDAARVRHAMGQLAESGDELRHSVAAWEALVAQHDEAPDRHQLATTLGRLSANLRALSMRAGPDERRALAEESVAHAARAVALLDELEQTGRDTALALELGRTLVYLSTARNDLGMHEEGEQALRRAIDIYRVLVREHPQVVKARADLGAALGNLAATVAMRERYDEAVAALDEATRTLDEVVALRPDSTDYRIALAGSLVNLGSVHLRRDENALAVPILARAVDAAEAVLTAMPNHPDGRMVASLAALSFAQAALATKDVEAAMAMVVRAQPRIAPRHRMAAASIVAGCIEAAQDRVADETLGGWGAALVSILETALDAGELTVEDLRTQDDHAALRAVPAVAELLAAHGGR